MISDNDSTNRLILFLGFDWINNQIKIRGLQHFVINRFMLNRDALIDLPAFNLSFNNRNIQQPAPPIIDTFTCYESQKKLGNYVTADDLVITVVTKSRNLYLLVLIF